MDLQGVNLSSIPTKSNHLGEFFLRAISPFEFSLLRMTLDALSHATIANVKTEICCGQSV